MAQKRKKSSGRISKVKRNNQVRTKLVKQGKIKVGINKRKNFSKPISRHSQETYHEEEAEGSDDGTGMLEMVDQDDLEFLKSAVVNKSYSLLSKIRINEKRKPKSTSKSAETLPKSIEDEYEDEVLPQIETAGSMKPLLPIKTKHGLIRREMKHQVKEEELSENEGEIANDASGRDAEEGSGDESDAMDVDLDDGEEDISSLTTVELFARRQEALQKRKFFIGVLCSGLLENPQEKVKNFKYLLGMMDEKNPEVEITVKKLASVSVLEVFKDILPSYQIKQFERETTMLKKDTLILRGFEKSLLSNYRIYLQKLEKMLNAIVKKKGQKYEPSKAKIKLAEVAFKCLCDLMVTHPYFNFWRNIVQLIVPFLNHKLPSIRNTGAEAVKTVFRNDKRGEITLEIVRKINLLVKAKAHSVHKEVLEVLLSLRLKEVNLDKEKEDEIKKKKFMTHKQKLLFLSKRERKKSKKIEELEKELLETKAEENKQSKIKYLTETTKAIFTIYFRILKTAPHSKVLSLTLEGLAKYAHCINIDFYHDLVLVLDGLVSGSNENGTVLGHREQLHCVQTVFSILSGPGIAINIDPLKFYTHLYKNLLTVTAGTNHEDLSIIISTLDSVLIKRRKKVSLQRQLAFTKRLSTLSLLVLHNGALSCLKIIKMMMQLNKAVDVLLDPESTIGGGIYLPELEEPEYCNASNSVLWELLHLFNHYHPIVRKFARHVLHGSPTSGEGNLPPELSKLSAEDLFLEFNPKEMAFKPAVPPPKAQTTLSRHPKGMIFKNLYFQKKAEEALKDSGKCDVFSDFDFYCDYVKGRSSVKVKREKMDSRSN
ncbi:nucleolar complex protein 3 homolog [Ischnura elegans]|uniref:nucleolar complex protein 3 homolog n=1 Tax=Ischnura elegans TaxID=197161 RepID=UPI001ED87698|nr:nucleolar complex protein 3 homolog [Ischnura elegans]